MMVTVFGSKWWGASNLTAMSFFFWFNRGYRPHPMPNQFEALKIAENAKIKNRRFLWAMIAAGGISLISAFWVNLDMMYRDGAISQVRLWRLGSLEHEIFPTDAAVSKLADILISNPGGGAFDLIWGPELDFKESGTNVHQFLGSEKYEPVLNNIYAGLGIPPTLTGSATSSGFTNNYISLKTLVQRLLRLIQKKVIVFLKM